MARVRPLLLQTPLQRKIMSVVSNNYDEEELELSTDMEFTKMKDDEKVSLRAPHCARRCSASYEPIQAVSP